MSLDRTTNAIKPLLGRALERTRNPEAYPARRSLFNTPCRDSDFVTRYDQAYSNHEAVGKAAMESTCEKCQGSAVPTAHMKSFAYEGQTLRCLAFESSCAICGHRWQDVAHEAANAEQLEQACRMADSRR